VQLSPHFTLAEFCASRRARELGIPNDPPAGLIPALRRTAEGMEDVRLLLGGQPIIPTSGYRSFRLNQAVGGVAENSQHMAGEACDFVAPHYGPPRRVFEAVRDSQIDYDQLILEGSWVHISFIRRPRRQALIAKGAAS